MQLFCGYRLQYKSIFIACKHDDQETVIIEVALLLDGIFLFRAYANVEILENSFQEKILF